MLTLILTILYLGFQIYIIYLIIKVIKKFLNRND